MRFSANHILTSRGPRHAVDPWKPFHFLVESEFSLNGKPENVATVFLTNRECVFHCLMCDLWKNTTRETVPTGAIPRQIEFALSQLPPARHVKLYNSGNFFDAKSIPTEDWAAIADLVRCFETVIVENHPRLCGPDCERFQQLCGTQLEVAIGLETSHAATLERLNKQMTTDDFSRACKILQRQKILIRAFILLKPPWTTEQQGINRAIESIRFAFDCGVDCCSVIPVRTGNGIMDQLKQLGEFAPPRLSSLVQVLQETLRWKRGRVFADLWDVRRFADVPESAEHLLSSLKAMNLTQSTSPDIHG